MLHRGEMHVAWSRCVHGVRCCIEVRCMWHGVGVCMEYGDA